MTDPDDAAPENKRAVRTSWRPISVDARVSSLTSMRSRRSHPPPFILIAFHALCKLLSTCAPLLELPLCLLHVKLVPKGHDRPIRPNQFRQF